MIEHRSRHRANSVGNARIDEYSKFAGFSHSSFQFVPLRFRELGQQVLYPLPVRMESKIKMSLGRIERQRGAQPDMKLNKLRLRLTYTHHDWRVPGPEGKHGGFLSFFGQPRKIVFRNFYHLYATYRCSAKLNEQRTQSIGAFTLSAEKSSPRQ